MTVKDLKELIANLPDDMEIVMQKDGEGNEFSPLSGMDSNCYYVPEETWYGKVYSEFFSADDNGLEEEEWQRIKNMIPKALVLFPVN
jgi:hypothetical protein